MVSQGTTPSTSRRAFSGDISQQERTQADIASLTHQKDYMDLAGLPCKRCAKRLIFYKGSKMNTDAEKASTKLVDGDPRRASLECRVSEDSKCTYCRDGKQRCDATFECHHGAVSSLLDFAMAAFRISDAGAILDSNTRAQLVTQQRQLLRMLEQRKLRNDENDD